MRVSTTRTLAYLGNDLRGVGRRGSVAAVAVITLGLGALGLGGCAHRAAQKGPSEDQLERRLLVLESEFADFVAVRLDRDGDGERAGTPEMIANVELETAALEGLRLRYLDVIEQAGLHRPRVIAMVRLAELHLDLASRTRRLPYPPDATPVEKKAWDERLSRLALPLEAVGLGVLEQVDEYAEHRELDGRFIRRARVYLALHTSRPLGRDEIATLNRELLARGPYGGPRRLLEAGRVGQRAARR